MKAIALSRFLEQKKKPELNKMYINGNKTTDETKLLFQCLRICIVHVSGYVVGKGSIHRS